jgi:hypothetical protein
MKQKTFKKLQEHGFTNWVATISGSLGDVTETGFELANASVQVFEKKEKEADNGNTPAEVSTSAPSSEKAALEPQKTIEKAPVKKKGLLDGIEVR